MADSQRVSVTNIDMPFGSMVLFMVKWTLAAIPALLILAVLIGVASALVGGMVTGLMQARSADTSKERIADYNRDVDRWREDCGQYEGRSAVASIEETEFQACKAQKAALATRASIIGASAPR